MAERVKEKLQKCKAILDVRYRWVGLLAVTVWGALMVVIISWLNVGIYFAVFTALLLINAFFTIDTCMTPKNIIFGLLPYILPIFGFIAIVIVSSADGLQLLTGMEPETSDRASADISYLLGQGFIETVKGKAPNITWYSFIPLYLAGFVVYAWSDASDRGSLKGVAAIVLVSPIMIQFVLGFTYGKSYGLLGSWTEISELLGYLGDTIARPLAVIIGSVLDFIIVSILFGIEHAIVEKGD